MKHCLLFLFVWITGVLFAQDMQAAQARADQRLESLKASLKLESEQVPQVKFILDETEQDCERIRFDERLTPQERENRELDRRAEEQTQMEAVLTADQYMTYSGTPVPAKANINTSRSSVKQNR